MEDELDDFTVHVFRSLRLAEIRNMHSNRWDRDQRIRNLAPYVMLREACTRAEAIDMLVHMSADEHRELLAQRVIFYTT